jgi:hypothetical protein
VDTFASNSERIRKPIKLDDLADSSVFVPAALLQRTV